MTEQPRFMSLVGRRLADHAIDHMVVGSVAAGAVQDAWQRRSMANGIDPDTGWKVDLIMLDDRPFSAAEFARRTREQTPAGEFSVQTAEDLILSKLHWAQEYESERQLRDAGAVFDVWRSSLDLDYARRWAAQRGVADLFEAMFERPVRE